MSKTHVLIVANKKEAHLPVLGILSSGMAHHLEPVMSIPLQLDAICDAIRNRLSYGNPPVDDSVGPQLIAKDSPLLRATKSRSWKQMATKWVNYLLSWTDEYVSLSTSYRDKQGRWQYDGKKYRRFPLDTPLESIVAVILADVHEQMEALAAL